MKRSQAIAATVALAVFFLVALSQVGVLTAKISPVPTIDGTSSVSPLSAPTSGRPAYDPYYRANPRTMTAHSVPYVNQAGETIVRQDVIERPGYDPIVID